jgi:putative peptidoglycan lipid II flippase
MGAITALSRVVGLVRVLVIAAVLGTTWLGDAFQSSNTLSNVLFELLAAGALSAVLVPAFVALLDRDDQEGAEDVAGGVLGFALLVLGGVTVVGVLGAPLIARLLTIAVENPDVAETQRDLVTFLLRFFVPQVLLYAAGTVAIAVLHAKRRFAVTAAAPIGNTVVMIALLGVFWVVAGPDPSHDLALSTGDKLLLAAAGTGGVVAFVVILLVACRRTGFRLRPRLPRGDSRVLEALRHAGWGTVLHTTAGVLLGAAIIFGAGVEGGVVAYQVGWVIFLAPYAIFAQPVHTAILPEMAVEARTGGPLLVANSLRWALERISLFVVPVTAGMIALAAPAMRVVSFGETNSELLAAAVAGLAIGLLPYSAFLLLARGYYALGDSRTPGIVALISAAVGVVVMGLGAALFDDGARVAALGVGHSAAYVFGVVVLFVGLTRRTGGNLRPALLGRIVGLSVVIGGAAWLAARAVLGDDPARWADTAVLVLAGAVGGGLILVSYRALGVLRGLTRREETTPGANP